MEITLFGHYQESILVDNCRVIVLNTVVDLINDKFKDIVTIASELNDLGNWQDNGEYHIDDKGKDIYVPLQCRWIEIMAHKPIKFDEFNIGDLQVNVIRKMLSVKHSFDYMNPKYVEKIKT
jgi:hypothetical protein